MKKYDKKLGKTLILDERFDLLLYRRLARSAAPDIGRTLEDLIPIEEGHAAFWEDFFKASYPSLDFFRRVKLELIVFCARIFGGWFIDLVIEAIEVYGIEKYLRVADAYRGTELEQALGRIVRDELEHEDKILAQRKSRVIDPTLVRDILFGFNDGLVEILGAVSGFFAALQSGPSVFLAGFTVAVAGSISMGAGAFAATSSEGEVRKIEERKTRFLNASAAGEAVAPRPWRAAFLVGIFYFIAALFPILPVFFGAQSVFISFLVGVVISIAISIVLSFISGMNTRRRILLNLSIIAFAVAATYMIGLAAKEYLQTGVF